MVSIEDGEVKCVQWETKMIHVAYSVLTVATVAFGLRFASCRTPAEWTGNGQWTMRQKTNKRIRERERKVIVRKKGKREKATLIETRERE